MEEEIIVSSPGKIIFHGEHAVVYGKIALATSLDVRTHTRLKDRSDRCVVIDLPDIGQHLTWKVDDIMTQFPHTVCNVLEPGPADGQLMKDMADFIGIQSETHDTKNLALLSFLYLLHSISGNIKIPAVHITVISKLPVSAGLGSSAAYSACLAAVLLMRTNLIKPTKDGTWSTDDLDLINKWAFQSEKIIHGNPSGIDNSICTYGGALRFQQGNIEKLNRIPELRILLTDTRIPRSTKKLVDGVKDKLNKYPDIIEPVLSSIEAISKHCQITLEEINSENHADKMYKKLEELIDMNQHHLNVLGVSHPTIEEICRCSKKYGLHSKLTGGGGGGCVFTLIKPGTDGQIVDKLKTDLIQLGFQCWETSVGGHGIFHHQHSHDIPDFNKLHDINV